MWAAFVGGRHPLDTDVHNHPRHGPTEGIQERRREWLQIRQAIAPGSQHDDGERPMRQLPLIGQILVHGDECIAYITEKVEQRSVIRVSPAQLPHRADFVADNPPSQPARNTVVQNDPHARPDASGGCRLCVERLFGKFEHRNRVLPAHRRKVP